jgi:hypothetical protein
MLLENAAATRRESQTGVPSQANRFLHDLTMEVNQSPFSS